MATYTIPKALCEDVCPASRIYLDATHGRLSQSYLKAFVEDSWNVLAKVPGKSWSGSRLANDEIVTEEESFPPTEPSDVVEGSRHITSNQPYPHQSLSTFHRFLDLPMELQDQIWTQDIVPETFTAYALVRWHVSKDKVDRSAVWFVETGTRMRKLPFPLFWICKATRHLAIRRFGHPQADKILFDPRHDCIRLNLLSGFRVTSSQQSEQSGEKSSGVVESSEASGPVFQPRVNIEPTSHGEPHGYSFDFMSSISCHRLHKAYPHYEVRGRSYAFAVSDTFFANVENLEMLFYVDPLKDPRVALDDDAIAECEEVPSFFPEASYYRDFRYLLKAFTGVKRLVLKAGVQFNERTLRTPDDTCMEWWREFVTELVTSPRPHRSGCFSFPELKSFCVAQGYLFPRYIRSNAPDHLSSVCRFRFCETRSTHLAHWEG